LEFLRLGDRKARLLAGDEDSGDEYDEEAQNEGWEELGEDEGGRGRSQGKGAESKPGLRCNEFPLYSYGGEQAEASSAGYGREAVKNACIYAMAAKRPHAM
jgi:hypothetical protein